MGKILGFDVNINRPRTEISTGDFLHNLSQKGIGYNKQFHVKWNGTLKNNSLYTISEIFKAWRCNPLRLFEKSQTAQEKIQNAYNLAGLVMREKENIVKDSGCDVNRIISAFARACDNMVHNTSGKDANAIRSHFDVATRGLQAEDLKYQTKNYETGRGKLSQADRPANFFKALSHTYWPRWFNERFQVIEPASGEFKVIRNSKPWFFKKWTQKPVPAAAKVATAEKLAAMVKKEQNFLRYMQLNTDAMISNLAHVKGRITKNTNAIAKQKIEKGFNEAIKELREIGKEIKQDWNNSWKCWSWKATKYVTTTAASLSWKIVKLPFQAINAVLANSK